MRNSFRPRLSYAGVASTIALVVALGGTAEAAGMFDGSTIANRSIAGIKLKLDTVTGKEIRESKLGTVPTAANAKALGGLGAAKFLHGTGLTGTASLTFGGLASGPVLVIPGVGTLSATCTNSSGAFDWLLSTTGSGSFAVMPVTLGDGFFPTQSRVEDTDTYSPKLLSNSSSPPIHGSTGSGSPGVIYSEGVVDIVPLIGTPGGPVTLFLTGKSTNPNGCRVAAVAQRWG